ncbi:MAG: shikimate dehydrogenase [Bacteroidetes bacterium]|nr:shikimate dehydrogenase [Bacteroidota bacterium]
MSERKQVGVIGFPVKHSLSPVIHNAALNALGIDAAYRTFEVRPGEVAAFLASRPAEFLGTNVTIPHKQEVVACVQRLSPVARATGAVNTVVRKVDADGSFSWFGDNTDVEGFAAPLRRLDADALRRLEGGRVVVLGAGGAARAVALSVRSFAPSRVTVVARNVARARRLVKELRRADVIAAETPDTSILDFATMAFDSERLHEAVAGADLIVNATPVGLTPNGDLSPLPGHTFHVTQIVYDLIYRPRRTRLLLDAERDGAQVIDGMEMLIEQAAASFVQWFGVAMPIPDVRRALAEIE